MFDVLFVHPPASAAPGDRPFAGVFPAEVGTDSTFRHAPLGLLSMAQRLERAGHTARIMNLAKLASEARRLGQPADLELALTRAPARVIAVGLHWAVHTPGALALAALARRVQPDALVVLGGMTATYFAEEALGIAPEVDLVLAGECEEAIVALSSACRSSGRALDPARIPNAVWRDGARGSARRNAVLTPKERKVDYLDHAAFWPGHEPDALVLPILRGCIEDCAFCGGARSAFKGWFGRDAVAAMEPDEVLSHLRRAADRGFPAALLAGDLRGMGARRAHDLLDRLAAERLPLSIQNELFFLAEPDYLDRWARVGASGEVRLTLSPESSSRDVRAKVSRGKDYSNEDILGLARGCGERGLKLLHCQFFAMPGQDREQIRRDIAFTREVVAQAPATTGFMHEPMLFVDPGSPIFRAPEAHGYRISMRTLQEIREHLERPYWTGALGYETTWLSRDELIDAIFEVFEDTSRLHFELGHATVSQHIFAMRAIDAHREVVEALRERGRLDVAGEDAPALVRDLLERLVPTPHRGDNNLKDYVGHARAEAAGRLPYTALPATCELLVGGGVPGAKVARAFERAGLAHAGALLGSSDLPTSLGSALAEAGTLARPPLAGTLVHDQAAFEQAMRRSGAQLVGEGGHLGGVSARATTRAIDGMRKEARAGATARPAPAKPLDARARVRLAPGAFVLDLTYPVYDLARDGPALVAARPGRYVTLVARGRSFTYQQEAAKLLGGLARGPARPADLLGGEPGPDGLAQLTAFLERLRALGAIEAAPAPPALPILGAAPTACAPPTATPTGESPCS